MMMRERYTQVNPGTVHGESVEEVSIGRESASPAFAHPRQRVPGSIRSSQTYYWSREWRDAEVTADEEIRRGELRRFADVDEAIRWLDDAED
jgi:hypothetical protein